MFFEYDRVAAVEYARKWALSRNPQFKIMNNGVETVQIIFHNV